MFCTVYAIERYCRRDKGNSNLESDAVLHCNVGPAQWLYPVRPVRQAEESNTAFGSPGLCVVPCSCLSLSGLLQHIPCSACTHFISGYLICRLMMHSAAVWEIEFGYLVNIAPIYIEIIGFAAEGGKLWFLKIINKSNLKPEFEGGLRPF
jgi:hypothetical protein